MRPNPPLLRSLLTAFSVLSFIPVSLAQTPCPDRKPSQIVSGEPVWVSNSGPWGDLEVRSIYLEAPDYLLAGLKIPNTTTAWNFPKATEDSLLALFKKADLSKELQERLLDKQRMLVREDVLTLFPEPATIEAMTQVERSVIYSELAKSPLNSMHRSPAYIIGGDADDWVKESHLTKEQKDIVKKLLWRHGDLLAFSDLSVLLSTAQSDADVMKILKFMTRIRTLVVELKLPPGTDWHPLAQYWTAGGRFKDNLPVLESTAERDSVTTLDITLLLPPTARRNLYTFPTFDLAAEGRLPDCQWTSLNFFNNVPRDYFLDARLTRARLHEAYDLVEPPYQYGDVLEFINGEGNAIHACVYIADDIVYTKNGDGMIKPWLLMWLPSVKKLYARDPETKILVHRLKTVAP